MSATATLSRTDRVVILATLVVAAAAGATRFTSSGRVAPFALSAVALALLASLVGRSVDAMGDRLGAGATGVLQSALGNLPELFVGIFALRAGLLDVVRAAIVGSILANVLLVLGLAFLVGGLRHGTQHFDSERARTIVSLLFLAVAALVVPTLADSLHTPAGSHEGALSTICSIVLLLVFALSVPGAVRRSADEGSGVHSDGDAGWPLWLALAMLAAASVGAAFVSDWFVQALTPAMQALHISQTFAGLVIVAIAGNAVENVVGIQLAARNQADYALSVILYSPLQVALVLTPALVLLSHVVGATTLTLVFSPLLVAALFLSTLAAAFIVYDGESIWLEGAALLGLYGVISASFWWG